MFEDSNISSNALFLITIISVGTTAFTLHDRFSPSIRESSPNISPVSIFPIFLESNSAIRPPDTTRKAVSPFSFCLKTY